MRIEQEDFDKLNQLDRIEYRQVEDRIRKEYASNLFYSAFYMTSFLVIGLAISLIIIKELNCGLFLRMKDQLKPLIIMLYVWVVFSALSDLRHIFKKRKLLEELDSKYFKHELKKRK